ncbi:hypothetical protein A2U01_0092850, partial [Trifolium medium]|nr:hypothetical protein [Trifolium medium]
DEFVIWAWPRPFSWLNPKIWVCSLTEGYGR